MTVARKSRSHRHRLLPTSIDDPVLMRPRGDSYLLLQQFADDHAAPLATPHNYGPGPGKVTVVETDGALSTDNGVCTFTAQTTPTWGHQGFYAGAVTRVAGQMLIVDFNISTWEGCGFGWHTAEAVVDTASMEHAIELSATDGVLLNEDSNIIYQGLSTGTDYKLAIVLRDVGAFYYLHDGTQWILLWLTDTGSTATLYPSFSSLAGAGTIDNFRTPASPHIPKMIVYDTFTRADADSPGSSEAVGPDGQSATAVAWAEKHLDWDIVSNKLKNLGSTAGWPTPEWVVALDAGEADVVVEGKMTPDTGGGATKYAGVMTRFQDTANFWLYQTNTSGNDLRLYERISNTWNLRASDTVTITKGVEHTIRGSAIGNVHNCWVDDAAHATYTGSNFNTKTEHGFRAGVADHLADDFAVWPAHPTDFPEV